MFVFLLIVSIIGIFVNFISWVSSPESTITLTNFISNIIYALIFGKLIYMNTKVTDNEDSIKKIKTYLGIKDGDPVISQNIEKEEGDNDCEK